MSGAMTATAQQTDSPYLPESGRIVRRETLTRLETVLSIEPECGRDLGHTPGQFVQVSIPGWGECPISVCSSPTRGMPFELCIRRAGTVTRAIHGLRVGDAVGIRGPLGHGFDIDRMRGNDVLIVAGGLGLAPARSLIQYVLDRRNQFGRFYILYGARSPAEILFREDVAMWQKDHRVDCLVTVDRPDAAWRGRSGIVTMLFNVLPGLNAGYTVAAIVGPPIMFRPVIKEVLARGIRDDRIFCSLERRMKCGIGKCGHCQISQLYACVEGPVLDYGRLRCVAEALE